MKQVEQLTRLVLSTLARCVHQPESVQYKKSLLSYASMKGTDSAWQLQEKYPVNSLIYFEQLHSLQFLQLCSSALHLKHQSYLKNILT